MSCRWGHLQLCLSILQLFSRFHLISFCAALKKNTISKQAPRSMLIGQCQCTRFNELYRKTVFIFLQFWMQLKKHSFVTNRLLIQILMMMFWAYFTQFPLNRLVSLAGWKWDEKSEKKLLIYFCFVLVQICSLFFYFIYSLFEFHFMASSYYEI